MVDEGFVPGACARFSEKQITFMNDFDSCAIPPSVHEWFPNFRISTSFHQSLSIYHQIKQYRHSFVIVSTVTTYVWKSRTLMIYGKKQRCQSQPNGIVGRKDQIPPRKNCGDPEESPLKS
jgi:hypothetical protein